MTEEKKNITVNFKHMEEIFGITLHHEFLPDGTYPLSTLLHALGFLGNGAPKRKKGRNENQ